MKEHPDHFLSDIAKHFNLTPSNYTKKKTALYQERNEAIRESFKAELEKIPLDQRIYLDESGINKYLYREHAGSLREKKVAEEVLGKQFARQSIISALFKGRFLSPMCFEGTCDTALFNAWLKQMLIPNLTPGQVLIFNNASFHKSIENRKIVEDAGCTILFLPPYSPDLNPIEKY